MGGLGLLTLAAFLTGFPVTAGAQTPAENFKRIMPAIQLLLDGDPIVLTIASPADGFSTVEASIDVGGSVTGPGAGISVQATCTACGNPLGGTVTGANYAIGAVPLNPGGNTITVTASHPGESSVTKTVSVVRYGMPAVHIGSPANAAVLHSTPVTVTGTYANAGSVTVNGVDATLDSGAGTYSASVVLTPGSNLITAIAGNPAAQAQDARTVSYVPGPVVSWTLPATDGIHEVSARWVVLPGNTSSAVFRVVHAGGSTDVTVDQTSSDGQWVSLGTYTLSDTGNRVELRPNADGQVVADAVRLSTATQTASIYNIYADHLNTPRLVMNDDVAPVAVWRWDNDEAFGRNAPDENPQGAGPFVFNMRLPGQYFDAETNLHYNYFRDYDPEIGRYVQSDPMGLEGGISTYAYVGGNPVSFVDPEGFALVNPITIGAAIGGVSGAIQAANAGGGWTMSNARNIAIGTLAGAASGAVPGMFSTRIGFRATAAIGGVAGAGGNLASQYVSGTDFLDLDYKKAAVQMCIGVVSGAAGWRVGLSGALGVVRAGGSSSSALVLGSTAGSVGGGAAQVWMNLPVPTSYGGFMQEP